jgi:hypothetical protein
MVFELNVDHNEIVDVIQMISNLVCRELSGSTMNDKVPAGPAGDLVGHMWRHMELPVVPAKLELLLLAGLQ